MKSYMQQVLAVGVLLAGAEANLLSWPRDAVSWFPPRETGAVEKRAGSAAQPAPTSPANLHGDVLAKGYANGLALAKRADDVCGYVSADPSEYPAYLPACPPAIEKITLMKLPSLDIRLQRLVLFRGCEQGLVLLNGRLLRRW